MERREAEVMACMTHDCMSCNKTWFNNRIEHCCPDCGGRVLSTFDEAWSDFDGVVLGCDDEDWYEEEEEQDD